MTTTTFTQELNSANRKLRLRIEPRIDELEDIENRICAMMMKTPDCLKETSPPFFDTSPDYLNPLKLKDSSSRIRVLHHIEEAELLVENNSNYIMQPFPVFESISWTLKPQIAIKSYEPTPNVDLEPQVENSVPSLFPSLLTFVAFKDEECFNLLPPIEEEEDKECLFQDLSVANVASRCLSNSNNAVALKNSKYCKDKSVGSSLRKDEIDALDHGVVVGERNEKLSDKPGNLLEGDDHEKIISGNSSEKETNAYNRLVTTENYNTRETDDEKAKLKFQYANFINENWEKEIRKCGDCIILVCKECGFEEYI